MTSFFEHQRISFKRQYLRNLILLASADGHLDDAEREALLIIGRKRGLKDWQVEELLLDQKPFEVFIPESFTNRMNLLYDFMHIVYADGKVDENEILFVQETLAAFNLSPGLWDELMQLFFHGAPSAPVWREFTDSLRPAQQEFPESAVSIL